jgi:hypothetical protein
MEVISFMPLQGVLATEIEKAQQIVKSSKPEQRLDIKDAAECVDVTPKVVQDVRYELTVTRNSLGELSGVIYVRERNGNGDAPVRIEAPGEEPVIVKAKQASREVNSLHHSILIKHRPSNSDGSLGDEEIAGVIFWQSDQCKSNGSVTLSDNGHT